MGTGHRFEQHGLQFRTVAFRVERLVALQLYELLFVDQKDWSAGVNLVHQFAEPCLRLVNSQRLHSFIVRVRAKFSKWFAGTIGVSSFKLSPHSFSNLWRCGKLIAKEVLRGHCSKFAVEFGHCTNPSACG
jgi:hypothetical protein